MRPVKRNKELYTNRTKDAGDVLMEISARRWQEAGEWCLVPYQQT